MFTYIIKSHGLYKIGRAVDIEKRLSGYRTHNPVFELILTIEGDCENILHKKYKDKRVQQEWFQLTEQDIQDIKDSGYVEAPKKVINSSRHETKVRNSLFALVASKLLGTEECLGIVEGKNYNSLTIIYNDAVLYEYKPKLEDIRHLELSIIDKRPGGERNRLVGRWRLGIDNQPHMDVINEVYDSEAGKIRYEDLFKSNHNIGC